jgi:NAD(P)-dependent dehydrogenase (short-subunit alcohol dehydrogenase family)
MSEIGERQAPKASREPVVSDRLAGKVAVVTGGSTGLGRQIARTYAAAGANVVIGDVDVEAGRKTVAGIEADYGDRARFLRADVTRTPDVAQLVEAAEGQYGRLDIMTANAGVLGRCVWQPLEDISDEDFDYVMQVNLYGVFRAFKCAIPALRRAGGGAMTATASLGAHRGFANLDPYCASKGGITSLVRSLSAALAPSIRVNSVSPGSMRTDLGRHTQELVGVDKPVVRVSRGAQLPGLPVADPEQVARVHLFLVSDEAEFVTGQDVTADGGWGVIPP